MAVAQITEGIIDTLKQTASVVETEVSQFGKDSVLGFSIVRAAPTSIDIQQNWKRDGRLSCSILDGVGNSASTAAALGVGGVGFPVVKGLCM